MYSMFFVFESKLQIAKQFKKVNQVQYIAVMVMCVQPALLWTGT